MRGPLWPVVTAIDEEMTSLYEYSFSLIALLSRRTDESIRSHYAP